MVLLSRSMADMIEKYDYHFGISNEEKEEKKEARKEFIDRKSTRLNSSH